MFVIDASRDFTRNRKFTFDETIKALLGMRGNTLDKELDDFYDSAGFDATSSAFVQQRNKIHPYAFETLFHAFNDMCNDNRMHNGYRIYAIDGTDLNIPYNKKAIHSFLTEKLRGTINSI